MNRLARIPFWGWYLFSVAFCYWLWNPYFSVGQLLAGETDVSIKATVLVITVIIASLYIVEGHRTLNTFAIILFFALFGCVLWLGIKAGVHNWDSAVWWGQWIIGLLFAIAAQGSRIYRNMFGVVTVSDSGNVDHDGHHH